METNIKRAIAFQIAKSVNIKELKKVYTGFLEYSDSDGLYYSHDNGTYLYVFRHGIVCFYAFEDTEMSKTLLFLMDFCRDSLAEKISEEFRIEVSSAKEEVGYNKIIVNSIDKDVLRIIMLNVAQSVALDYYSIQAEYLLEDTQKYTQRLEQRGELAMAGKKMKRYIGKSLNLKNRISGSLYIFETPPGAWENERLNTLDISLKKAFDLQSRTKAIHENIQIIKDNLDLFKDLVFHKRSSYLEWIIILLILVEVLNMIVEKLF